MPRLQILTTAEQNSFDRPPVLDSLQRKKYFDFPKGLLNIAHTLRNPSYKIGFLVMCGYFRVSKKFFLPNEFHNHDIEYVTRALHEETEAFQFSLYPNRTRHRHEQIILEYYGFNQFCKNKENKLIIDINAMVHEQLKPKFIFGRSIDLLLQAKVEVPSSYKLTEIIIKALNKHRGKLEAIIIGMLTPEIKKLLDDLFVQENSSPTSRYRLTFLKNLSQSTKPTKVKERAADLKYLAGIYEQLNPIISAMELKHEGIKYFASSVLKSQMFQLQQRSDEDRYVHVIAFIVHQYFRLQDNLVDVLLSVVRTFHNTGERKYKDLCYEQRKTQKQHFSSFLGRLDGDLFTLVKKIRHLSHDENVSDTEKIKLICSLLEKDKCIELEAAKQELENEMTPIEYYNILESRSVKLQNRVSPIIKSLAFQAEPSASDLMRAIQYFKAQDGAIKHDAPLDFLDEDQKKAVTIDQKINPSLYKAFMFMNIANAIKTGTLNLIHSYKYRPLDNYIISKERWDNEKELLIRQAELEDFTDCQEILNKLDNDLNEQYLKTNSSIESGGNTHFKMFPAGGFRIATPALEAKENDPLQTFFPEKHFVSLTEVLSTVDYKCKFLDQIKHHQQMHTHKKGINRPAIFASLMGLGCGIGTRKMAQISTAVKESEIEHAVNWYLSLDNIRAANDSILAVLDKMDLPNIYRRNEGKLHTSSDGQKFTVKGDSLNANYSFKYGGKEQVVAAYSFIDERGLLWYSLVFSAAERESAYVIDGLMHNDVVKSDIHSTDTHGYSEVIFGTTHLLGFSYAPRIKNLKKQTVYIFKSRKNADKEGWGVLPKKYISEDIIMDNWDDILRLICTIKLKETTASDIFRRLNSYSKQHVLYKAMKAFGQIIKSNFILRYVNDLELRQAIEKQLNKVELANKFTRAVAVGSPKEFSQGAKEEQEIAEACNRLIKNAIICWNYMYLEKKIKSAESELNKEIIMSAIKNHSPISWAHINLLGEYDFSENKLKDSVGVLPTKKSVG